MLWPGHIFLLKIIWSSCRDCPQPLLAACRVDSELPWTVLTQSDPAFLWNLRGSRFQAGWPRAGVGKAFLSLARERQPSCPFLPGGGVVRLGYPWPGEGQMAAWVGLEGLLLQEGTAGLWAARASPGSWSNHRFLSFPKALFSWVHDSPE